MKVGICIIDIKGQGRHVGVCRRDAHANEGDMQARVAKHRGVIAQDVRVFPLFFWDLSDGGGMCGLVHEDDVRRWFVPTDRWIDTVTGQEYILDLRVLTDAHSNEREMTFALATSSGEEVEP